MSRKKSILIETRAQATPKEKVPNFYFVMCESVCEFRIYETLEEALTNGQVGYSVYEAKDLGVIENKKILGKTSK